MARRRACPRCAELERLIESLRAEHAKAIAALTARIEELEERLNQNSSNSSMPPSSDRPDNEAPARTKKKPSGRKPGGQPGRKGSYRKLLPPEDVDRIEEHDPTHCKRPGCGRSLADKPRLPDPRRHQVTEVPDPKPETTEHDMFGKECDCGCITYAELPEGVPRGAFGPRLIATIALLLGAYRQSRRNVEEMLRDLFKVDVSLGSVVSCQEVASKALADPVDEANEYVQEQKVAGADETSWRERRQKAWLWVASTPLVAAFLIHASRGKEAARALLGKFEGVLGSDRWSAYKDWRVKFRQICWAHLKRDFTWISERKGEAGRIGRDLLAETAQMFEWWHRVRDGTLARSTFRIYMGPLRHRVEALLQEGTICGHLKVESRCRGILELFDAMWTFVRVEGVEPTNNASERALRSAVIWRKLSFGSHSAEGSRFVERILTTTTSLRLQGRNVTDFITEAVHAAFEGRPAPSLLPRANAAGLTKPGRAAA